MARRGEQVTVLSRHTTDDGSGWVEAKAAKQNPAVWRDNLKLN